MKKIYIGVLLALSAVNGYGAVDYSAGYSQGAVSNVSKYYKPLEVHSENKQHLEYRKGSENVEVIHSINNEVDHNYVLSEGYIPIGYSEFKDRLLPDSVFVEQAQKVGSQKVLVYKQGVTTVSYSSDDDLNNLDYGYHYSIIFYVKNGIFNKADALGVFIGSIPLEKTKLYQRNTGAYVNSVIRNSRAYNSNIVVEDVVTAINGIELIMPEDLIKVVDRQLEKVKTLNFTIIRIVNNEPKEIQIPVSFN